MRLHLIQSPLSQDQLQALSASTTHEDALIMLGHGCANAEAFSKDNHLKLYSIENEAIPLGYTSNTSATLSYRELVKLCTQAEQVLSWYS